MTEELKGPKRGKRKPIKGQVLTEKQELFAQKLASGMHFTKAFREVYDCTNMAEMTSYKKSFVEKDHPKIAGRVLEIKEMIQKATDAHLAGEQISTNMLPVVREAVRAQAQVVERVLITRQTLTDMFLEDRAKAHELGQISASVGAGKAVAQLHGLISDSRETKAEATDIERMDADALRQFISAELEHVGLSPSDVGLDIVDMRPKNKALN